MTKYYQVAEHVFGIEGAEEYFAPLTNYAPFEMAEVNPQPSALFTIKIQESAIPSGEGWEHVYTDTSDDDMPRIEMFRQPEAWLFRASVFKDSGIVCAIRCSKDWREVILYMEARYSRFAIDNAAMLVYAFATIRFKTLLFHSSVTMRGGKGYMFLGHSGTGKSTHSKQWMTAFADAQLLNDDNPAVRIYEDGTVRVFGTPWSGKTPCYKNADVPVAALVQLEQAPHNEMTKLRMSQAYPFILGSVSGLKVLPEMMDQIYESIASLLELIPVYRLECLPNLDAARLCAQTCSL